MKNDFELAQMNKLQKLVYYQKEYGMRFVVRKAARRLGWKENPDHAYQSWYRVMGPMGNMEQPEAAAFVSVTVVVDDTKRLSDSALHPERRRSVTRESIRRQTYAPHNVMVVSEPMTGEAFIGEQRKTSWDGSIGGGTPDTVALDAGTTVTGTPDTVALDAGTTVTGAPDWYVFVAEGVILHPDFLAELVKAVGKKGTQAKAVQEEKFAGAYTDEDQIRLGKHCSPYLKPDRDPELLLNFQYLGGAVAVSADWLLRQRELDLFGNDWYDLALRLFESGEQICHIPGILFSETRRPYRAAGESGNGGAERASGGSASGAKQTAAGSDFMVDRTSGRLYRDETGMGRRYIEESLKRRGRTAVVEAGKCPGFYHVCSVNQPEPLVSVIIPNMDHTDVLSACIESIQKENTYQNYEILIAENNSKDPETFRYYEELCRRDQRIRVVKWEREFNYSAINNFAAQQAAGELLLFLNNDTKIKNPQSIREMAACCGKEGAAAAGAMLYYPDGTIQHGGVVIGIGGFAAHALLGQRDSEVRYESYACTVHSVSACTGACLMVRREDFFAVRGFTEELAVALNDIDLCLKLREQGKTILFNPYAQLYHFESKSRGYEDSPEKVERFNREIAWFQKRWGSVIEAGDPYYNRNLTLYEADYSMRW